MRLVGAVRAGAWSTVAGYGLFVALMVAGYYYNLTFVQLGLLDLGTRVIGLSPSLVSAWMAVLALATLGVAVATGVTMDRRGWSTALRTKLRLLLGVVVLQLALTVIAPELDSNLAFGAWILTAAVGLGVGFPVSFSLATDLIPVPDRGYVAAAITAIAYVAANAVPLEWSIHVFRDAMLVAMLPGLAVLLLLVSGRVTALQRLVDDLATQHQKIGPGRFCRAAPIRTRSAAFFVPVGLVFAVFFIDSLGFLRIVETPALLLASWQSPAIETRLFIAGAHVVGAIAAGVLYVNFDRSRLFLWTFALFALTHVLYTSDLRLAAAFPSIAGGPSPLNPAIYAVAVSFYTTLNFAIWPDLSTPTTVGTRSAIGIGVGGWLATFLSTALALYFGAVELPLLSHLNVVQALSLLTLFVLAIGLYARRAVAVSREARSV